MAFTFLQIMPWLVTEKWPTQKEKARISSSVASRAIEGVTRAPWPALSATQCAGSGFKHVCSFN